MKKLVIFTEWYLPAFKAGGPVRSVANLVQELEQYFLVYVVSSNTEFGEIAPFEEIEPNVWYPKGNHRLLYLDRSHQKYSFYSRLLNEIAPDWIYLNSLFSFKFTLLPLLALRRSGISSKILLAPRGMLGAGALGIKPLKKKVFISLSKITGFFKGITWHATSVGEENEIKLFYPEAVIFLAPNLSDSNNFPTYKPKKKEKGTLRMYFVSRISLKKNLLFALEILKKIQGSYQIEFVVFGPIEDEEYWFKCQILMEELSARKTDIYVHYAGEIKNEELFQYISPYHLFFLPTLNENFGHAIVEAFKNGSPVLISDQTPWKDLADKGVGHEVPLNQPQHFIEAIEKFAQMDQETYNKWSLCAYSFAKEIGNNESIIKRYFQIFNS